MDRLDIGVLDCLFPVNMRSRGIVEVEPGTILDVAPDEMLTGGWAAIVNGKVVHRDDWGSTYTHDGMEIIFSPLPGDFISTAWVLEALAYAAVGVVVNYGVGKLLGLDEPRVFDSDPDSTYSFNNLQQTAESGRPIKIVYGDHALAGNILELSLQGGVSATGSTTLGSSMDVTVGLCEGEITALNALSINGNDIELDSASADFGQLATPSYNLGTNDQEPLGSEGTSTTQTVGIDLEPRFIDGTGGNYAYYTTTGDVDKFRLNLFFTSGLYRPDGSSRVVDFSYEYRHTSDAAGAFSGPFEVDVTASHVGPFIHSILVEPVDAGNVPRRGTYEIRVRYTGNNGPVPTNLTGGFRAKFDSVVEIQNQVYAYPNLATLRLQIVADSALNGSSVPNIIATVRGRKIQKWDGIDATNPNYIDAGTDYNNPAWVALDIIRDSNYGIGSWIQQSKIDIQSFKDWADYCNEIVDDGNGGTEKRATFNGVFDGGKNAWDALNVVCASARASIYALGETLRVRFEAPRNISQMFSAGSIGEGSFQMAYMSRLTRPTRFEAQFLNAANNYQPDVVGIEDLDSIANGEPQRTVTIELPGITRESQALRECRYRLQVEKLSQVITFDADIDAVAVMPGDVIRVAADMPNFGTSGRVTGAGSGTDTITIDRDVTLEAGITYKILVRHSADDTRTEATITSAAGDYTAGSSITTDTTWTAAPAKGDVFIFGPVGRFGRDLIVTSIRTTGDLKRTVEGVLYDPEVYNDGISTGTSTFKSMIDDDEIPGAVTRLTAVELEVEPTTIAVAWEYPEGISIGGAHIYERPSGEGDFVLRETVSWPRSQIELLMDAEPNFSTTDNSRDVAVVAFNTSGSHLPASAGASVTVTPAGLGKLPESPTSITAAQDDDLIRLAWTAPTNANVNLYEVRRGYQWVGSRLVGVTRSNEIVTGEWTPTLNSGISEKYMVRPITAKGQFGDTLEYTETNSFGLWEGGSYRTNDFRDSGAWTGSSYVNMAINSDGDLEISTPGTQAKWQSSTYDMGSSAIYRFGTVLHTAIEDLNWTDSNYAWKDRTGRNRNWAGQNDSQHWDTAVLLEFRTRTSSSASWSNWRPMTTRKTSTEFREIQLRITATPTNSDQVIKIKEAWLVIEIV